MTTSAPLLSVAESVEPKLERLIAMSYGDYIDVNRALPWHLGVDRARVPKKADCCWLYDTPQWHALDAAQRHELLWQQNARDVAMFIWLEQTLPPVYVGYVNQYGDALPPLVREYMMLFAKEEIVHTLMFRRYVALAKMTPFAPPEGIHEFFVGTLPKLPPVAGVLFTYLVEIVAETGAMHGTQDDTVDPLTRQLFAVHHREEARHIAFGRWVIEAQIARMPADAVARLRSLAEPFTARLLAQYTYNAELAGRVSFDLGVAPGDDAAVERIRSSPNNRQMNAERFGSLVSWLQSQGLAGPELGVQP